MQFMIGFDNLKVSAGAIFPQSGLHRFAFVNEGKVRHEASFTLLRPGVTLKQFLDSAKADKDIDALIEGSSRTYRKRMQGWIDVALEEGLRFFVTSLGNPRWVVERVGALVERAVARAGNAAGPVGRYADHLDPIAEVVRLDSRRRRYLGPAAGS